MLQAQEAEAPGADWRWTCADRCQLHAENGGPPTGAYAIRGKLVDEQSDRSVL